MMGISDIGKGLTPPSHDDKEGTYRWRWYMFIAVMVLILHAAATQGLLPYGVGEKASASDVQMILELQFAEQIRELQKEKCSLPADRRQRLDQVIEDYQRRYTELTGKRYPVQPCPR